MPVYPSYLALCIRLVGDFPSRLVICQHLLAIMNLLLFFTVMTRLVAVRTAFLAAGLWLLDPFRVYYSSWLLAETLFIFWLLLAVLVWLHLRRPSSNWSGAVLLGLVLAMVMLTRPIGVVIPVIGVAGLLLERGRSWRSAIGRMAVCAAGVALLVGPWLARNQAITGRFALSHQSGVSLAYFKVVDVLLWERGQTAGRFDIRVLRPIYEEMDRTLRDRWEREYGPLTDVQREELRWDKLIYGEVHAVNPVDVSRILWQIGLEMLKTRKAETLVCYSSRTVSLLTYPLAIAVWPPTNEGSMPFASLIGSAHPVAARALAAIIGVAFAAVAAGALIRVLTSIVQRRYYPAWFALIAAGVLIVVTIPFEDPRFREPLMPFLFVMLFCAALKKTEDANAAENHFKSPAA